LQHDSYGRACAVPYSSLRWDVKSTFPTEDRRYFRFQTEAGSLRLSPIEKDGPSQIGSPVHDHGPRSNLRIGKPSFPMGTVSELSHTLG
jgi:hypothetical protein